MIENSVKQIIKDLIFYQWRLPLHWSKTFPTSSGKIFPTLKESEQLPVQLCPFSVYTGWHWQSCDLTVFMQVALKRQEWLPSHSSISKKLQIEGDLIIMETSLYISRYRVKDCNYGCSQPFAGLREQEIVLNVENKLSVKKGRLRKF